MCYGCRDMLADLSECVKNWLRADSVRVGSVQTGASRNDFDHVMVIHLGRYTNARGKVVQVLPCLSSLFSSHALDPRFSFASAKLWLTP